MKPKVKRDWVKALRSGDYPQDANWLRTLKGYCCLGVLCQLAVKEGVIQEPEFHEVSKTYDYDAAVCFLPRKVVNWAGLDTDQPCVPLEEGDDTEKHRDGMVDLAVANDLGESFEKIADRIEKHL